MKKIKLIFVILPYLLLIVIISLIVDYFWKVSDLKKEFQLNEMSSYSNEEVKSKVTVSMHQIKVINQNSDEFNFTIFSENEIREIRFVDFKFIFEDYEVKIKRNIVYELNKDNPNFFKILNTKECDNESLIYQYDIVGGFENYKKCKINVNKVFKKIPLNFGEKIPVKIIIHYYVDGEEYFQDVNSIFECIEGDSYPPNWFMFFFPGAY